MELIVELKIFMVNLSFFFFRLFNLIIKISLGYTAFDYILDIDEWLTSKKFNEDTHARLQAYKYKDIRTFMYTISAKLDQFDSRLASNRNIHLQRTFQKYSYELNKTENEVFQSPRLRKR